MDHRLSRRLDTRLDVLIYNQGVPVAAGKTRNISLDGIYVETGYKPKNGNLYLDIEFVSGSDTDVHSYHVKGLVVHSSPEGIGLLINDFDPENKLPAQLMDSGKTLANS